MIGVWEKKEDNKGFDFLSDGTITYEELCGKIEKAKEITDKRFERKYMSKFIDETEKEPEVKND